MKNTIKYTTLIGAAAILSACDQMFQLPDHESDGSVRKGKNERPTQFTRADTVLYYDVKVSLPGDADAALVNTQRQFQNDAAAIAKQNPKKTDIYASYDFNLTAAKDSVIIYTIDGVKSMDNFINLAAGTGVGGFVDDGQAWVPTGPAASDPWHWVYYHGAAKFTDKIKNITVYNPNPNLGVGATDDFMDYPTLCDGYTIPWGHKTGVPVIVNYNENYSR